MLLKRNHLAWLIGRPTPKMEESRKNRFGAHCSTLVTRGSRCKHTPSLLLTISFEIYVITSSQRLAGENCLEK